MALPKLNENPNYSTTVPSTGEKVTFRPYLVKEEKVLMIAFETGDQNQALGAIVDTLKACISEDISLGELTTFDIEYLFTQVRSKAVGEVANVVLPCIACQKKNEISVQLSDIEVQIPEKNNVIELTPTISVEMKYPSYNEVMKMDLNSGNETELGFSMLAGCIAAIQTEEERIDTKDVKKEEVMSFIEQMTTDQFKSVSDYLQDLPSLQKEVVFDCSCGEQNVRTLKGINDFLS